MYTLDEIKETTSIPAAIAKSQGLQLDRHRADWWAGVHQAYKESNSAKTFDEWIVGKPLYEAPTTELPLDADVKSAILSAMEHEFDRKLRTNTVEVRAEVKDANGTVTTPALRLKARPADAGLIQGALGIMAAKNLTKYSWWNSPAWHELTVAELTKLMTDGVASIAVLFAEFETLTKTLD